MENKSNPAIRENTGNRNPDGTFIKGISGNPSGRPRGTMKDYLRRKFMEMTDEAKEEFLKGVSPEMQIKLAEGNPDTKTDVTSAGKPIPLLYGIRTNNGTQEDTEPKEEN